MNYCDRRNLAHRAIVFALAPLALVALSLVGCATAPPATETAAATQPTTGAATAAARRTAQPAPPPPPRDLFLPVRRARYFADGVLESYTLSTYDERARLLDAQTFNAADELIGRVVVEYSSASARKSTYGEDGEALSIHDYDYDDAGNVVRDVTLDERERVRTTSMYEYDAAGRRTTWRVLDGDGSLLGYTEYVYGPENLQRANNFNASGSIEEYVAYRHNAAGMRTSEQLHEAGGTLIRATEMQYADELLTERTYRNSGRIVGTERYDYDDNGNVVRVDFLDRQGRLTDYHVIEYERRPPLD